MPIHLRAPEARHGGPDGQGWTRLAVASTWTPADQCALRPRNYATLWESQDTRRARWGLYGPCVRDGACGSCPIAIGSPRTMSALTDRVLVRIDDRGAPWAMNRPEDGWASRAHRWTWDDLARLNGWVLGEQHHDEHGDGFWLVRATA